MSRAGKSATGVLLVSGLLAAAWRVWWLEPERRPVADAHDESGAVARSRFGVPKLAQASAPALEWAADGAPIMPARAEQPVPDGPAHPHPITAQHLRIYEENRLIEALNGAVDVANAGGIRALLARYRAGYPEDAQGLQDGYQAVADCLEHPGAETQAAAQHWSDQHHGSTVRRFVMRICQVH
jgi:hypothetical protein